MQIIETIRNIYRAEPALVNALVVGAVMLVASLFNVVLDKGTVAQYVVGGLALLLGTGFATRRIVAPVPRVQRNVPEHMRR